MKKNFGDLKNVNSSEKEIKLGEFGSGLTSGLSSLFDNRINAVTNGENLFIGSGVPSIQLLVGMRDLGYTNIQATHDIIDNCIDAIVKDGKGIISILTNFSKSEKNKSITFIDNGCGMNLQTLSEALIFGKDEERCYDELGKFGIGMKTSALSMGRLLKVITKSIDGKFYTGIFDYDEAFKLKSWDFQRIIESPNEDIKFFKEHLQESTGTIVSVSKLDRLDDRNETNKKQLDGKLLKNIAETFRNFISTSNADDKIKFYYNGKKITPIDPMCRDMQDSYQYKIFNPDDGDFEVEVDKKKYNFKVICYHVPYIEENSVESQSNMRHTSYKNSGFYIMRNDRQIQRATWHIFQVKNDEDTKIRHSTGNQFRAELFFNSDCDEIFKTDTKKMTINLPQPVIDKINIEVWSYLRGVQRMHEAGFKKKSQDDVLKDLNNIARKMNNKISTPTILKNKLEKEIPSVAPKIEDKNTDIKKKEHFRNKNKKIEFNTFAGETTGSFLRIDKMGVKKYVLSLNANHVFYTRFGELDNVGKELFAHFLHSMALTLYSELYDVFDSGEVKIKIIEDFIERLSTIFRKDSEA